MSLCEIPTKELTKKDHAMTLNQSALLELTEAMRTADDSKLMRTSEVPTTPDVQSA